MSWLDWVLGFISFFVLLLLIYAFQWVFSFIAYFFGFLSNIIYLPLNLIDSFIYPVWDFVYTFWTAWILLVFGLILFHLFSKHD